MRMSMLLSTSVLSWPPWKRTSAISSLPALSSSAPRTLPMVPSPVTTMGESMVTVISGSGLMDSSTANASAPPPAPSSYVRSGSV